MLLKSWYQKNGKKLNLTFKVPDDGHNHYFKVLSFLQFLDASTHLYKRLYLSIRRFRIWWVKSLTYGQLKDFQKLVF